MHLTNPVIQIYSNDATPQLVLDITEDSASATINFSRPVVSGQNTFGRTAQRREIHGLWDGSVQVTFNHDYREDKITQTLFDYLSSGEQFYVYVRATDAPISNDNPEWRALYTIEELPVVDGDPESLAQATVTFLLADAPEKVVS